MAVFGEGVLNPKRSLRNLFFIFFLSLTFSSFQFHGCGGREKVKINFPKEKCNILSRYENMPEEVREECFFPYPFEQFMYQGRVSVPSELIWIPDGYPQLDLSFINSFDGFSPVNQIMFWHPDGFSPEDLPEPEETLSSQSPIQLIEWGSRKRIPVFVEPDVRAKPPYQVLYIRPLFKMKNSSRYVVVIKKGLKGMNGNLLESPLFFKYLVEGKDIDFEGVSEDAGKWKKHFEEILDFLESDGIKKVDVLVAWDFKTASEKLIINHLLSVKKTIYDYKEKITFVIDEVKQKPYSNDNNLAESYRNLIAYSVEGRFYVPKYDNPSQLFEARFKMNIPSGECFSSHLTRVMIFGHGLFGSYEEISSNHLLYVSSFMCLPIIATKWIGIDDDARGKVFEIGASKKGNIIDAVKYVVFNLKQGHANFLALAILINKPSFWQEVKSKVSGFNFPEKPSEIVYYGISNGAIQGGTFMALTDEVKKGVLDVGGAIWTSLLERNKSWDLLKNTFGFVKAEQELELKKYIALSQIIFDLVDPVTFAEYVTRGNEKLGIKPKFIFYREALYDEQVANFATETYIRVAGIPGINKPVKKVFGIEFKDAPFDGSAYLQVDPKLSDNDIRRFPKGNIPPSPDPLSTRVQKNMPVESSGDYVTPHEVPRRVKEILDMQKKFYDEGKIYQFCSDKICDPD
jgi:hypothetical protein